MKPSVIGVIRDYFGCDYLIPVGGGLVGLFLTLKAIGVRGRKVLIPAITGWTVPIAVSAAGGTPVLVDLSYDDCNISVDAVKEALEENVAAVIAVDSFGYPADIRELKELAHRSGCVVIEDACHAYGGGVDGDVIGSRGDAGTVSFGYSKPIALEGGGFVVTNDEGLYHRISAIKQMPDFNLLKNQKNWVKMSLVFGGKYRTLRWLAKMGLIRYNFPSGAENAIGEHWAKFISEVEETKANLKEVRDMLASLRGIESFRYAKEGWMPWRYSFKITDAHARMHFEEVAKTVGLAYGRLYPPLTYYFKDLAVASDIPNARRIGSAIFNLVYHTNAESTKALTRVVSEVCRRWN